MAILGPRLAYENPTVAGDKTPLADLRLALATLRLRLAALRLTLATLRATVATLRPPLAALRPSLATLRPPLAMPLDRGRKWASHSTGSCRVIPGAHRVRIGCASGAHPGPIQRHLLRASLPRGRKAHMEKRRRRK